MFHVKEKAAQLVAPDYAQILFDGEKKLKFPLKIDDLITGMIFSGNDIDAEWTNFKTTNQQTVQDVVDELNAGITQ